MVQFGMTANVNNLNCICLQAQFRASTTLNISQTSPFFLGGGHQPLHNNIYIYVCVCVCVCKH